MPRQLLLASLCLVSCETVATSVSQYCYYFLFAEVPSAPVSLSVSYTAMSVYLEWSLPAFIGNSAVLGYRVYQRAVDSQSLLQLITNAGYGQYTTNSTMFNVTSNITPYTKYEYAIEACNAIGCSKRLMYSPLRTDPAGQNNETTIIQLHDLCTPHSSWFFTT